MEKDVSDSPTGVNSEGIQNPLTNTQNPEGQAEMVTKEEYINAQAFGTKARQNEIAMATKLPQPIPVNSNGFIRPSTFLLLNEVLKLIE